jgi:hypothetical protein
MSAVELWMRKREIRWNIYFQSLPTAQGHAVNILQDRAAINAYVDGEPSITEFRERDYF